MKHQALHFIKHPLISGSAIVFIGTNIANVLGYLFNLIMGRGTLIPVSEFGLLTSLTSLTVLFGVFQITLIGIIAKFAAKYKASNNTQGFSALYYTSGKFVGVSGFIVFCLLLMLLPAFSSFLKIENNLLLIFIFISIAVSILTAFPIGLLQGEMRFISISAINIFSQLIKIIASVALVLLGMQLLGVMLGILLASVLAMLLGVFLVLWKHQIGKVKTEVNQSNIFIEDLKKYSLYFFLATFGITIISNADIILARSFFDPITSSQYSALSLMGKAIFYLTSPIYFVFFPLIAQKQEKNEAILSTLLLGVMIIMGISVFFSFIYFLFPQVILQIFFPAPEYKVLANYLGPFSLFIAIFSIANLFNNFFLSIGKTGVYKLNLGVAALFIVFMVLFHGSIYQVIGVMFGTSLLLLTGYLVYYYIDYKALLQPQNKSHG